MNSRLLTILLLIGSVALGHAAPAVTFSGAGSYPVLDIAPEKNTGLDHVYVAYTLDGLSITAPAVNGKPLASWMKYDSRGGGYATELTGLRRDGDNTILEHPEGDTGYILEWPDAKLYFWLTDYSAHRLDLAGIRLPSERDCNMLALTLEGTGAPVRYTTINGRQLTLGREITITYSTLEWNEPETRFDQKEARATAEGTGGVYLTPPPLCNTTFTATGDRFMRAWDMAQTVESPQWQCDAVEVHTTAGRTNAPGEGSNQIGAGQDSGDLGGSAPADVAFRAYISDAVLHCEWQFATDPQFEDITHRFNQQDLDYTFNEEGVTYVRFVGSNADGTCTAESETYTVQIGASELKCPNAFSPGASEGVNDLWKVSYRSLTEFECWIFNRYGTQLFHFSDPEDGWDGKYRGKLVPPGVYFYVIEARGADGKQYRKAGDINILRYKTSGSSTGGAQGAE